MVASELAKAFNCSVNDLPLSLGALMAVTWWGAPQGLLHLPLSAGGRC
jgi:hypothetical protein